MVPPRPLSILFVDTQMYKVFIAGLVACNMSEIHYLCNHLSALRKTLMTECFDLPQTRKQTKTYGRHIKMYLYDILVRLRYI